VTKAIEELLGSMREPLSGLVEYRVEGLDKAIDSMVEVIRYKPDLELVQRFNGNLRKVKSAQDEQWDILVDRVIAIASTPQLNWRYVLSASRILLQVQRRDRPTDVRMAKFHAQAMLNAHPRLRDYAIV
jgi:proteasome activator subunit 4